MSRGLVTIWTEQLCRRAQQHSLFVGSKSRSHFHSLTPVLTSLPHLWYCPDTRKVTTVTESLSPSVLLLFRCSLCLTLCDPMDCSTPGFPVLHYPPEFAHIHVLWVDDAIQPSHPLSSPSPPSLNLSQHQGLSKWVSSLHQMAERVSASTPVPPMNTQDWSPLGWTGWISLQSKGLSRVFSNTTVQKHQFFGAQLSL